MSSLTKPDPQCVQLALTACDRSHTEIHRAIAALKRGEVAEAKRLMAQSVAFLANAMSVI